MTYRAGQYETYTEFATGVAHGGLNGRLIEIDVFIFLHQTHDGKEKRGQAVAVKIFTTMGRSHVKCQPMCSGFGYRVRIYNQRHGVFGENFRQSVQGINSFEIFFRFWVRGKHACYLHAVHVKNPSRSGGRQLFVDCFHIRSRENSLPCGEGAP